MGDTRGLEEVGGKKKVKYPVNQRGRVIQKLVKKGGLDPGGRNKGDNERGVHKGLKPNREKKVSKDPEQEKGEDSSRSGDFLKPTRNNVKLGQKKKKWDCPTIPRSWRRWGFVGGKDGRGEWEEKKKIGGSATGKKHFKSRLSNRDKKRRAARGGLVV